MTSPLHVKNSQFKLKHQSADEKWLVFDCETNGLYEKATKTFCIALLDIQSGEVKSYGPDQIDEGLSELASADVLVGHNIIFYDLPVLAKLQDFSYTGRVIDTLVLSRLIWPKEKLWDQDEELYPNVPPGLKGSASLKAWGYRLADHKIEFKDFSQYSQEMLDYCIQDVKVTHSLFQHCVHQAYPAPALQLEHEFAEAINLQIRSGVPFCRDGAFALVDRLSRRQSELQAKLQELFPPTRQSTWFTPRVNNSKRGYQKDVPFEKVSYQTFNPASRQQIVQRLKDKYGWEPDKLTDKGNAILDDEVLEKLEYPEAKYLAEYQLLKKRLGQIQDGSRGWLKCDQFNGRIHGSVNTNGCVTGRCSHSDPNLGQVPASYSPYGKECRSLFHAEPGYVLLGCDAKALELRCLAGYLAYWDQGTYGKVVIDPDQDIHIYNQHRFGVETRDIAKRLLYAVLYGAGYAKAGHIINPNLTNEDDQRTLGRTAINAFFNSVPAIRELKNSIEQRIEKRGHLIGLDQRLLHCRSSFKGLNVLLQSAGAILMKKVVCLVHDKLTEAGYKYNHDWQQVLMIHDEIQLMVREEHVEPIKELVLQCFPDSGDYFGFKCKIEGDARAGATWADTH